MFKERKKFALLSLLSALVVVSTAFVGISIYAQTDDSELTTFEEEAIAGGEKFEDTMDLDSATSAGADNATEDTTIADISSLFDGLVLCDLGTAEVSAETQTSAFDDTSLITPTVSVKMMTAAEVAELVSNETSTASVDDGTSTSSTACVLMGEGNSTSTANNNATDGANATSTAISNATLTGADNAASLDSPGASNATSTASTAGSNEEILVIEGQDFAPGQVVLIFSENALVGIDDVDPDGNIEAKIPMPDSGDTAIAGNDNASTELRFVESGTQRTSTFDFDGKKLTAGVGGDIEAAEATPVPAPAPNNATSTNSTSSYTVQ